MPNISSPLPEYILDDINYRHYLAQYQGHIDNEILIIPGLYLTPINYEYAKIAIRKDLLLNDWDTNSIHDLISNVAQFKDVFTITYINALEFYTLQEISAVEASNANYLQLNLPLNLTGSGVVVGVIDTGIDYLNEEFMTSDGKSRINEIWDQGLETATYIDTRIPYGTIYNNEEINNAINASRRGENPYDIVPSKDTNGHGTNMTGLIAASGKNPNLKGIAPNCNIVAIKLKEATSFKADYDIKVPIFSITTLFTAIEYLKNYAIRESKPLVIYLPLGTTHGNHKGNNILDEYLQSISNNIGIVVVTGSGNEADSDGHVSGLIKNTNDSEYIQLTVSPEQKELSVEVWVDLPCIISLDVVSPSGEQTGLIPSMINSTREHEFIFEKTSIYVQYFLPEEITGDELIRVYFYNLQSGTWRFRLKLMSGQNARFNAWLPQKGISLPGTRFSPSDPFATQTIPSDSSIVITAAAYNQNNNNTLNYSGMASRYDYIDRIDVAAGGTYTLTVGLNNQTTIVNGTSVSAAIVAGACIFLLEWGIIDNNFPYMYSQSIKTFIARGTTKRRGDVYPNPEWGYGIIDFYKIFESIT